MINKAFHLAILGFYTVFSLFIGLGALLFNAGTVTALTVFASVFLLCGAAQAAFIILQLVRFGANAFLDLEDASLHLRDENEKMRQTLDRFADILDTALEQQQELEGKLSVNERELRNLKQAENSPASSRSALKPEKKHSKPVPVDPFAEAEIETQPDEDENFFTRRQAKSEPKTAPISEPETANESTPDFLSENDDEEFSSLRALTIPEYEDFDIQNAQPVELKTEAPYTPPLSKEIDQQNTQAPIRKQAEAKTPRGKSKTIAQKEYKSVSQSPEEEEFEELSDSEISISESSRIIHAKLNADEEEFIDVSNILSRSKNPDEFVQYAESGGGSIAQPEKAPPVKQAKEIPPEAEDFFDDLPITRPRKAQDNNFSAISQKENAQKSTVIVTESNAPETKVPPLKELVKNDPSLMIKNRGGAALQESDVPSLEKLQKSVGEKPENKPEITAEKNNLLQSLLSEEAKSKARPQTEQEEPAVSDVKNNSKIKRALRYSMEHNTADLFLRPTLDFMTKEVRFFEGHTRIRDEDNQYYGPNEYMRTAAEGGMAAALDRLLLTRSVQIIRSLVAAKKNIGLFANVLLQSVTDDYFFEEFIDMIREKGDISKHLVPVFKQEQLDYLTSAGVKKLMAMKEVGFRFCLDCGDASNIALEHLAGVGFRYLKITPEIIRDGLVIDGAPTNGDQIRKVCNQYKYELLVSEIHRNAQAEEITRIGCDLMSGDLYGEAERVYKSQLGL